MGDMGMGAMPAATGPISSEGKPDWQVPAGWQEVPGGQFLVAKFTLAGEGNASAAVNVSNAAGEGGGLIGNVNRWRGQLGLGQLSDADVNQLVTTIDVQGGKASLVDLSGTGRAHRPGRPARWRDRPAVRPDLVLQTDGQCESGGKPEGCVHPICQRCEILKCSILYSGCFRRSN